METEESKTEAVGRAFAAAGLDATGIDLASLAVLKIDTENQIALGRKDLGFTAAKPAASIPRSVSSPAKGAGDGTS
jgi:hypothetical protein